VAYEQRTRQLTEGEREELAKRIEGQQTSSRRDLWRQVSAWLERRDGEGIPERTFYDQVTAGYVPQRPQLRVIDALCDVFDVRSEWLLLGEGPKRLEDRKLGIRFTEEIAKAYGEGLHVDSLIDQAEEVELRLQGDIGLTPDEEAELRAAIEPFDARPVVRTLYVAVLLELVGSRPPVSELLDTARELTTYVREGHEALVPAPTGDDEEPQIAALLCIRAHERARRRRWDERIDRLSGADRVRGEFARSELESRLRRREEAGS